MDDATRAEVADWLGKLGFRLAGTHRSKDVTLYRHGAGSIVLNAEADSFASAFFQQHGLSLCASAFRVDDAKRAFERAAAYGYAPFSGRIGPNERVVPGVQAPDGSLDYFVDEAPGAPTLWESDFVLTDVDGAVRSRAARRASIMCACRCPPTRSTPGCCFSAPRSASRPSRACSCPIRTDSCAAARCAAATARCALR